MNLNDLDYRYLDDVEEGMINNVPESAIDYYITLDNAIERIFKTGRSEILVLDAWNFEKHVPVSEKFKMTILIKKYPLRKWEDDKGNVVLDSEDGNFYVASEDALQKMLDDYK